MPILSTDLVKQFVESTHDETETKEPSRFYGTASVRPDGIYVILDGSTIPTPVSMATDAQTGDVPRCTPMDTRRCMIRHMRAFISEPTVYPF